MPVVRDVSLLILFAKIDKLARLVARILGLSSIKCLGVIMRAYSITTKNDAVEAVHKLVKAELLGSLGVLVKYWWHLWCVSNGKEGLQENMVSMKFSKLKLSPRLIRLAYRFFDVEASAEIASPDGRIIEYSFVIQKLAQIPRGKVLKVGCTARLNYLPAAFASFGGQVRGIDLSTFKFKHQNAHFVSGEIGNTDVPDNFFDALYAVSTIEHLGLSGRYGITKGNAKAIREMARVLRPSGTVPHGKEAKVIKSRQRIYEKSCLVRLFHNWTRKGKVYYHQGEDGYWISMPEEDVVKVTDPRGDSTIALPELSPN